MSKTVHDHDNLGGSNKILNLAHAAQILDMPPDRLRRHWNQWGVPGFKVGRELRFVERDLRAWIAEEAGDAVTRLDAFLAAHPDITISQPGPDSSGWIARRNGMILSAAETRQDLLESLTWLDDDEVTS